MNNTSAMVLEAKVTLVPIGVDEIEGLMDEKGDYYVSLTQICKKFSFLNKNAARDIKHLMGKYSKFLKNSTIFVKLRVPEMNRKPVNCLPLEHFEVLLIALDRIEHNAEARQIRDSLVGLSLNQLFCDAFGVKFEKEERQEWLKARMLTKETFWFMSGSIQRYYSVYPREEKYFGQNYSEPFDALNFGLFGKRARDIKKILGITKGELNRDHFGKNSLKKIEMIQRIAEAQMDYHNKKPIEAVKSAIALMNYQVGDFRE